MRRLGKEKRVKGLEPDSDPLVLKRDKDIDDAVAAKASVAVSRRCPPIANYGWSSQRGRRSPIRSRLELSRW